MPDRRSVLWMLALGSMVASTIWVSLTSEHLVWPLETGLYRSFQTCALILVGLAYSSRRPESRFGPLLLVSGVAWWVVSWQAADWPVIYGVGVLLSPVVIVLTFYACLAFGSGYLRTPLERGLIAAFAVVMLGCSWTLTAVSPITGEAGPFFGCAAACPRNVFQLTSAPELSPYIFKTLIYGGCSITAAIIVLFLLRFRRATRPRRRALVAVSVFSLVLLPTFLVYHVLTGLDLVSDRVRDDLGWALVGTRTVFALGFALALYQATVFSGTAMRQLMLQLGQRPTACSWRDAVARALDDSSLRLGFWDPVTRSLREPDGGELLAPIRRRDGLWVPVERDGHPVAALLVDPALSEDPELLRVAATATLIAVETGQLRERLVLAGDVERRRIERDLHDSAQQRLVGLRIRLGRAGIRLRDPELDALGRELDIALEELRFVAQGMQPPVLARRGVADALRAVTRRSPMPIAIVDDDVGRFPAVVESTVYFCCLEGLQNAGKHAGPGASATVTLTREDGALHFVVADDGRGFDPIRTVPGGGLTNIADRLAVLGGAFDIEAKPGAGTRISGVVRVAALAEPR